MDLRNVCLLMGATGAVGSVLTTVWAKAAERQTRRIASAQRRRDAGARKAGNMMPDGTVYAGISPDTGEGMYATPADAKLTYSFNQAQKYAEKLDAHGHDDWRVPSKGELNVLFQNRAAIGGFDETGWTPAVWYWSSSPYLTSGWAQRFSDGLQDDNYKNNLSSLRCVR